MFKHDFDFIQILYKNLCKLTFMHSYISLYTYIYMSHITSYIHAHTCILIHTYVPI